AREHRDNYVQMLELRAFAQRAHHVGLDIDREQLAVGYAGRDTHGEVARAGAEIGDTAPGLQLQRIEDLIGLLPGIASGIVELFGPMLCILKRAVVTSVRALQVVLATGVLLRRGLRENICACCSGE